MIASKTSSLWTENISKDIYQRFGERYRNDPADFALDCFRWEHGEGPTNYQLEILDALVRKRRVSVRGPHGLGKTGLAAWVVLWFALTRDALMIDWKIPTTASAWRQLTKFLWPEIRTKWLGRLNWRKIGRDPLRHKDEIQNNNMRLNYGEAFALASNRSELIEGAHADSILYVFDESKAIPPETWDSAEGAMVNEDAFWLSISTPGPPMGRFYQIQSRWDAYKDWYVRHVTLQEAIDAGRVTLEWAEDRRRQWGEHSAMYQNRVLGEFAQDEEDALIPLWWVELATQRWQEWRDNAKDIDQIVIEQVGVDVARSGKDATVFAKRNGNIIFDIERHGMINVAECSGKLIPYLKKFPNMHVVIDIIGVGGGVYDNLEADYEDNLMPFHAQERTDFTDDTELYEFRDCYSAAWWNMRQMLDPEKDHMVCLPQDDDLVGELTAPKWTVDSGGAIRVERKEKVKDRLGRSPDKADATVMAFWPFEPYGMGFS